MRNLTSVLNLQSRLRPAPNELAGGVSGVIGVERGNSLLPIVLLLPGALIAMNATSDWAVFDGMIYVPN